VIDAPRWTYEWRIDFSSASVRHLSQTGGGQSRSSQQAHASMERPHTVHFKTLVWASLMRPSSPRRSNPFAGAGRPAFRPML